MHTSGIAAEFSQNRKRTGVYVLSALVGIFSGLIIVFYRMVIAALEGSRRRLLPELSGNAALILFWLAAAGIMGFC
jgi:hypothetical protein